MTHALLSYQDLYHVFQPICRLSDGKSFGYEALIRSKAHESTDQLFRDASQKNSLFELDALSIYNAVSLFRSSMERRNSGDQLFLNVFPSSLAEETFPSFCDMLVRDFPGMTRSIVFEINESMSETGEWNRELFVHNLCFLRTSGFRIAFDDVGEGATTLKRIVELSPDFIKMDRFFGMQLAANQKKQHILKFFVDYCRDDTLLILEGLEEPEDLKLAIDLGVKMGQGYLLAKPGPLPGTPLTAFHPLIQI